MIPTRILAFSLATALAGVAVVACSSSPDPSGSEATASGASASTVDGRAVCPSARPPNGTACAQEDLLCSWGSDPRFGCREEARCESGAWVNLTDACPPLPRKCPANAPRLPDGGTTECLGLGITCAYGDEAYTCATCKGGLCIAGPPQWQTSTLAAGCPDIVPNFGDACSVSGTYCNYNICAGDFHEKWVFGAAMECEKGLWVAYADTHCP